MSEPIVEEEGAQLWVDRGARRYAPGELLTGGYRLVANTGPDSGQTVFHAHVHVLGGGPMGVLG